MALQVSRAQLEKATSRLDALKSRLANVQKGAEHATEKFVATIETTGAAFAMGVLQGKTGGVEVVGVPLELGLGVAGNLASYFKLAGKHSDHLANLANGCLAAYAVTVGRGVGQQWQKNAELPPGEQASGRRIAGASLSPAEMANVAAQAMAQGA